MITTKSVVGLFFASSIFYHHDKTEFDKSRFFKNVHGIQPWSVTITSYRASRRIYEDIHMKSSVRQLPSSAPFLDVKIRLLQHLAAATSRERSHGTHQTGKPENHRLKSAGWDGIC